MTRDWHDIAAAISRSTSAPFDVVRATPVSGGDINQAYRLEGTDGSRYFVKLNRAEHRSMFATEHAALETITSTDTIRVPRPFAHGSSGQTSFLVLEHLDLHPHGNALLLGEQLAAFHHCRAPCFGWPADNFIGTTSQQNTWNDDWIAFWREHRLGFQLRLAASNGYGGNLQTLGERLLDALPAFFKGYTAQPSLLHGDLWSGNHAYLGDGTPVLFDPASYFGDLECDLAMTELFGGFGADFHAAYRAAFPLDAGYVTRRDLYNLYHILNHANLFGGSYVQQAAGMMQRLLAAAH